MRTSMSASAQPSPLGGMAPSCAVLSLLQQQNALQAYLQQQQQNAQAAPAAPAQPQAPKPVLKRQNEARPPNAAQQDESEALAQASRQRQLAQLEALKQKMKGETAQLQSEPASGDKEKEQPGPCAHGPGKRPIIHKYKRK
jgi:hypothetical protein